MKNTPFQRKASTNGYTARCNSIRLAMMAGAASVALIAQPSWAADSTNTASATAAAGLEEITVTAQRREENILRVPISVSSFSTALMDVQGIRDIGDISRLTTSLTFTRTAGVAGNNGTNIAIRGVFADVGSATTGIYIDDMPIQIRSVGYFSGNPYPRIFDIAQVEVLRGPQGTLFGAGSMGGAVRFLTKQPDFEKMNIYVRSEGSSTSNGADSYELGAAINVPANDKIAVQTSAWYRHDGGYIDRVVPVTQTPLKKDINDEDTYAARFALAFRPSDNLTITPSVFYQRISSNGRDQFWEQYTAPGSSNFKSGIYNAEPSHDRFYLTAAKIEYDFDAISFISSTSYFDRGQGQSLDYATYLSSLRTGSPFGVYANKDTTNAVAAQVTTQKNFTQEFRAQSANPDSALSWLVGAYYSSAKQYFQNLSQSGRIPGVISAGFPQYLGRFNLLEQVHANDEQIAGFTSVDYRVYDSLKLTAGLRVTHNKFDFSNLRDGPVNSGRQTIALSNQSGTSITPRFVVSYDIDTSNMVYASASKGFRPGGGQLPVDPNFCAADLATLGLTQSPLDYESDSLWSFEGGSKNALFGGRLTLDANAFLIKWKNIQQTIRLPTCNFAYVDNLGNATARGLDVSISLRPMDGLSVGGKVGYTKNTFDQNVLGGRGLLLRGKGDLIGGPNLTGSVFGQVDREITSSTDGYVRVDYSFAGNRNDANPLAFGFDVNLPALESTDNLTARAGVRFSSFDVSLFVDNLTNTRKPLSRSHDTIGSPLYYVEAPRPRTIGLTANYHY